MSWPTACAGRRQRPAPPARRGTAFHAWLDERFGTSRLIDLDELPRSGDAVAAPDAALAGVPGERVSAGFHHVAAGMTLRPVDLLDEAGLLMLGSMTACRR